LKKIRTINDTKAHEGKAANKILRVTSCPSRFRVFGPSFRLSFIQMTSGFCLFSPRTYPWSCALLRSTPGPVPILGDSLLKTSLRLLLVKSRGHVYPLSYLSYF